MRRKNMKKLLSIITAAAMIAALSGCTENASETVNTAEGTASQSLGEAHETKEASETEISSETEEYAEESAAEEEADIAEDDDEDCAEPAYEPFPVYAEYVPELPANAKLYDMSGNIPDMPEFTLSTDGLYEYDQLDVSHARLRIKSILECAVSGEVPAYKSGGYVWESPQKLAGIRLNGWEIADEKLIKDGNIRYEVTVTMDVAESDSEFVPAGRGDYLIIYCPDEDSSFLPLRKVGELDESRLLPSYGDPKAYVDFCTYYTAYFRSFFSGGTIDDFSAPNVDYSTGEAVFCAYVAAYRAGGFRDNDKSIIPYDEFNETLEKILGFSADAVDAKSTRLYNADKDCIEIPGRGTSWVCGWLAEDADGDGDGTRVVTVDYYEDDFYLVKSRTVRYTVRNNDDGTCSMLKIERLFTSDRNILAGCV